MSSGSSFKAFGTLTAIGLGILVLAGTFGIVGFRIWQAMQPERPDEGIDREIWVKMAEVRNGNIERFISATGEIHPWREVNISSKIPGKVAWMTLEEGDHVQRDDVLLKLDTAELDAAKRQTLAAMAAAKATMDQAKIALDNQEREFGRARGLFDSKLVSEQQFQSIEMMVTSARAQYEMTKTSVAQAEAALDLAETRLSDSEIRSPISGIVVKKSVNVGEIISPTIPILRVIDLSKVKIHASIPETEIMEVKTDTTAHICLVGCKDVIMEGRVATISSAMTPGTHSFRVTIEVTNEALLLKAGMSALVDILAERRENVLIVPRKALGRTDDTYSVYVVDAANTARYVEVDLLSEDDENCQISGLDPGQRVIIQGSFEAVDGAKVIDRDTMGAGEAP